MKFQKVKAAIRAAYTTILLTIIAITTQAQTTGTGDQGTSGIEAANTAIRGYFPTAITLMYAIGAVVGIIGAVKVYGKWNSGDQDTNKVAASWFGSCIFLVVVATILKSFFNIA